MSQAQIILGIRREVYQEIYLTHELSGDLELRKTHTKI